MANKQFYYINIFFIISVFFINSCASTNNLERLVNPTSISRQLVLVITDEWNSPTGTLQYFDRDKFGTTWQKVSTKIEISIGKNGLAWGNGLHGNTLDNGPVKKEGDGKAPAGVFTLSAVYGYAEKDSVNFLKMPYIVANKNCFCVDDVNSVYYNTIVDSLLISDADWHSREKMKLRNDLYKWGIVIDHNKEPRIAGNGSCIFFHIWSAPKVPTDGCTVFTEKEILEMIKWMDISKKPILVQLPKSEYNNFKSKWNLP